VSASIPCRVLSLRYRRSGCEPVVEHELAGNDLVRHRELENTAIGPATEVNGR
jgi:hypothetical protein